VKLLLDTHVFLWIDLDPDKLSRAAVSACKNPDNELFLSVVSAWEIQIKQQLKRLTLNIPLSEMVRLQRSDNNLQLLPIQIQHVYSLDELPFHHNDPFDRLLIAQARHEKAVFVSADRTIGAYSNEVELLW